MYGDPLDKVLDGDTKFDDSYYSFDTTITAFIGRAYIHTYIRPEILYQYRAICMLKCDETNSLYKVLDGHSLECKHPPWLTSLSALWLLFAQFESYFLHLPRFHNGINSI